MKTIWIISDVYFPDESATGYLLTRLSESFSDYGSIHIITAKNEIKEHRGVTIHQCRFSRQGTSRNLVVRSISAIVFGIYTFFFGLTHIRSGDIIITLTSPPSAPIIAHVLRMLLRCKLVLIVHDVFPENIVAILQIRYSALLSPLKVLFRYVYAGCDRLIVIGRDMKVVITRKTGREDNVIFIPNWSDIDTVFNEPVSELRRQLQLDNRFVIGFFGNIGRAQGIENILSAASILQERNRNVHLLFVGQGSCLDKLQTYKENHTLENISILPSSAQLGWRCPTS